MALILSKLTLRKEKFASNIENSLRNLRIRLIGVELSLSSKIESLKLNLLLDLQQEISEFLRDI